MDLWVAHYRGDLGIALTDTITTDVFLRDFDAYYAKLFDGVRLDSGDPFEVAERFIAHYERLKIDPACKVLVFSDALDDRQGARAARAVQGPREDVDGHRHPPDERRRPQAAEHRR